jgi:hypothetical protein
MEKLPWYGKSITMRLKSPIPDNLERCRHA